MTSLSKRVITTTDTYSHTGLSSAPYAIARNAWTWAGMGGRLYSVPSTCQVSGCKATQADKRSMGAVLTQSGARLTYTQNPNAFGSQDRCRRPLLPRIQRNILRTGEQCHERLRGS